MKRRHVLGAMVVAAGGCVAPETTRSDDDERPPSQPGPPPGGYGDNLDALLDVLLPAERDEAGNVVSVGAREVGAAELLDVRDFIPLAQRQGLVPALPEEVADLLGDFDVAVRAAVNVDLDVLAAFRAPLTAFRDLARADQDAVVEQAFDDEARRPLYAVVRAAAFGAYLGAGNSDAGLVAVGHPPFEDLAGGVAVSGYPRSVNGQTIDYTFNLTPEPTAGIDLGTVLDAHGDLF